MKDYTIWFVDTIPGSEPILHSICVQMQDETQGGKFLAAGFEIVDVREGIWS